MSPKKLSDAVKQEILQLYRETNQTTSTLSELYGVSSSTISRFLKTHLSPIEYDQLIQQKRLARVTKTTIDLDIDDHSVVTQETNLQEQSKVESKFLRKLCFLRKK